MTKRQSPSAHDVAALAGVSQAAVSRAFTPGASVSKATRAKVLDAAQKLGYRPNLLARSLIKGESGLVGVVVGAVMDPLVISALEQLSERLSSEGKHILMFTAPDGDHADAQVEDLLKYRVETVLLMAASLSTELTERCYSEKIPVVFFNRQFGAHKKFNSFVADNRNAAREVAQHMLDQGYERFGILGGMKESSTGYERTSAFATYLSRQGKSAAFTEYGNCSRDAAIGAAKRLLSRKDRPDAIFCANDQMAIAVLEVARYEFGLEIGREIGIAGMDDIEQASWPSFDLTTHSHPVEKATAAVLDFLLTRPWPDKVLHKTFKGELKVRGSTRRR